MYGRACCQLSREIVRVIRENHRYVSLNHDNFIIDAGDLQLLFLSLGFHSGTLAVWLLCVSLHLGAYREIT